MPAAVQWIYHLHFPFWAASGFNSTNLSMYTTFDIEYLNNPHTAYGKFWGFGWNLNQFSIDLILTYVTSFTLK